MASPHKDSKPDMCVYQGSTEIYWELWMEALRSVAYEMTVWKDRPTHLLLIYRPDLLSALRLHMFLSVHFGEVCVRLFAPLPFIWQSLLSHVSVFLHAVEVICLFFEKCLTTAGPPALSVSRRFEALQSLLIFIPLTLMDA